MRKTLFTFIFTVSLIFSTMPVYAASDLNTNNIPYFIETTIEDASPNNQYGIATIASTHTVTKTKTTTAKAQDGSILYSVSITATFSYNGSTSKCITCAPAAKAYARNYSINSVSASRSDNSANATASITYSSGNSIKNFSQLVTIKCSKNGTIS